MAPAGAVALLYEEFAPPASLRPIVRCLWTMRDRGAGAPSPQRIVPDGCAELIVNLGESFERMDEDGAPRVQEHVLFVGQLTRAIVVSPRAGVDLVGVRFEPGGLHALAPGAAPGLTDVDARATDIHAALGNGALEAAAASRSVDALFDAIGAALPFRRGGRTRADALVDEAAKRLESPFITVDRASAALGVTPRTLERHSRARVGIGPKRYQRIRRVQRVVAGLDRSGASARTDWAGLAATHGYADQPHLIREFREIAGVTPAAYDDERTPMADHLAGSR